MLDKYYHEHGCAGNLPADRKYLCNAFVHIEQMWMKNYHNIEVVRHILLAEAPLYGTSQSYIYNPAILNTQFFYRSDLEVALGLPAGTIQNKAEFLDRLNAAGIIVLDISPFAFNSTTGLNYQQLSRNGQKDYKKLLNDVTKDYLLPKIALIKKKSAVGVNSMYRYSRVEAAFGTVLREISGIASVGNIGKRGGGIDRSALKGIIERTL